MTRPKMARMVSQSLVSVRALLISAGPVALLAVLLLVLAYWWLDPNPPQRVRLATGPAQSAYDAFGQRYAAALAEHGIAVELVPSEGSSANLALLRSGQVDLGFVQGGSHDSDSAATGDGSMFTPRIGSLGSLFVEPVWFFYRTEALQAQKPPRQSLSGLTEVRGLRINIGTAGSGVPTLMRTLLEANQVEPETWLLSQLEPTPAVVAFLEGQIDALVFASAPQSLMVQMLLQTPGVQLMDFAQAEAYARRFTYLTPVVLPRGVVNLATDLPPRDIRLVAPTTALLARDGTHPAIRTLFSQAAVALHGDAGWFNRARQFPSAELNEFPLWPEAERTLRSGTPLLQRYLPFWVANLIERMWLVLGLIVAVLLPLSRIVPPLYEFRVRSRVFRWYAQLRDLEDRQAEGLEPAPVLLSALDEVERQVGRVVVPLSYTDELYALRQHIALVRSALLRGTPQEKTA